MRPKPQQRQRRRPQQARAKASVDRVLAAAARVLARDGYYATTTRKIAREAGLGIGSIYEYFADKDAVVAALVAREVAAFEAEVVAPLAVVADHDLGACLLRATLDFVAARGELARVLLVERADVLQRGDVQVLSLTVRAMLGQTLGADAPADGEARLFMVAGMLKGVILEYATATDRPDPEALAAICADAVRRTFAG